MSQHTIKTMFAIAVILVLAACSDSNIDTHSDGMNPVALHGGTEKGWVLTSILRAGTEVTDEFPVAKTDDEWVINSNGTFRYNDVPGDHTTQHIEGTWVLSDDKTFTTKSAGAGEVTWTVLELNENTWRVRLEGGAHDPFEYTYKPSG